MKIWLKHQLVMPIRDDPNDSKMFKMNRGQWTP